MMYSTNILLNLISTIFKTINSSVDDTKKTLALFNKDWNTYKTNWQKGFASNGFAGGVKSVFQSTKSVVSPEQIQMLRTWNNAVKHGCTNQETFNKIIANADHNTKMYFAGLNKGKGTLDGLKKAQNATKASTIGLTIAQTALNMAISMGLMAAISLAIKGFDKMINHAKRASEAADEAFEETSSKVQEQQEELKTLDELISKYKELKKDGTLDIEGRKEVKELQNDIADLVGTQARNLDLVNGKLDDEIKKLDEISAKEAKNAYETATANYNNSQRANQNATGDDSFLFVDGYAYTGKREKDAEKILKEYGFGNNVQSAGFFGNTLFVMDTYDNDMNMLEGAQEKADYLQSMIDVLEQNGQRATELYSGLISQRDKYLNYIDNQQGAANTLVSSWITYSQYSNEELSKITVDSVESFEAYRQKMIEAAKNDESVGKLLSDGTLSEKDLEVAVNDFMATSIEFSDWYKQWIGDVQGSTSLDKMTVSLESLKTASESVAMLQKAFKELSEDGYITVDTLAEIQKATGLTDTAWEEYESKLLNAKVGSNEFKQAMTDLTYKMIEEKVSLDGITFATEDEIRATENKIAAILRENNVLNANEIAHEAVERAKAKEIIQSKLSKGVTEENIKALMNEAGACDIAKDAYIYLIAQEILFNNNSLDTSKKIEALKQLAVQAGITGAMVNSILDTPYGKDGKTQIEWAHKHGFSVKQKQDENGEFLWTQDANGKWVEDWIWTDADGNTYENANEAVLSAALKGFADALNDENPSLPEYDPSDKNPSAPDKPDIKEADYSDYYDEILSDKQKMRDRYKEEDDKLQREFEQAIEDKNLNDVDRIVGLIKDNNTKAVEQLSSQLSTSQKTLDDEILPLIYGIAPELQVEGGWDAVTDVQKEAIREKYKKAILDENNRWEEQSYDILSKNGNKQNDVYKQAEADHTKAIEKLEYESDMFDQLVDSADAYVEDIKEIPGIMDEWNDKTKDAIEKQTTSIDDVFEEYKRHIDRQTDELQKQADVYDILINKAQALADGSKSMYDSLRSVRQLQRDISKELATNKALGEYLDEDARKLLFNEEDYDVLSRKLKGLSADIAGIGAWYETEISNLTEDNWYLEEAITKEYERRLASKEKEYEIARAELDIEKKKLELNNILNEKNIRILTKDDNTGKYSWTYVHNVQEAAKVTGEIADLEAEISETRLQSFEDSVVNQKQREADLLRQEQAAIETRISLMEKETNEFAKAIDDIVNPLGDFEDIIKQLNAKLGGIVYDVTNAGLLSKNRKNKGSGSTIGLDAGDTSSNKNEFSKSLSDKIDNGTATDRQIEAFKEIALNRDYSTEIDMAVTQGDYGLAKELEKERNNKIDVLGLDYKKTNNYQAFDQGGSAVGKGFMFKDTEYEELVLDPEQTDYFKRFTENISGFDILAQHITSLIKLPIFPSNNKKNESYSFTGDIVLPNVREPEDFMIGLKKHLEQNSFRNI